MAGTVRIVAAVLGVSITYLSAPLSTGEPVAEHERRPVARTAWPVVAALLAPFDIAMVASAVASSESDERWRPVWVAALLTIVIPIGGRLQGWLPSGPRSD